jgi:hypothetical protein
LVAGEGGKPGNTGREDVYIYVMDRDTEIVESRSGGKFLGSELGAKKERKRNEKGTRGRRKSQRDVRLGASTGFPI